MAARYQLGDPAASAWFTGQGVTNVPRFVDMLAPRR